MLDLCCGLGGASRAMRDRGWRVIGVDNLATVVPDVVADVRSLPLRPFKIDLLWASPPCNQFADPRHWGKRYHWNPDLSIHRAIKAIVEAWQPRFWIVENVHKSRPYLVPVYGPVFALVPGHVFWGRLPGLLPDTKCHKGRWWGPSRFRSETRSNPHKVSLIPYEISLAVARAVEGAVHDDG